MKKFENSQKAWEHYNEDLFSNKSHINYSHISVDYDQVFDVGIPRVNPMFDFAKMFNYRINKWKSLVGNYLNLEELKEIKTLCNTAKNKTYNHTLKFTNTYKNGKDCLISCTFSKRVKEVLPLLIFHTRALECTKRMLLDLLLIQRMGEYVYGKYKFRIIVYCPMIYLDGDTFTMYHNHKSIYSLITNDERKHTPLQKRNIKSLREFQTKPIDEIKYKVNKRCARQLQFDKYSGQPIGSGSHNLFAKDLKLTYGTNRIKRTIRKHFKKARRLKPYVQKGSFKCNGRSLFPQQECAYKISTRYYGCNDK